MLDLRQLVKELIERQCHYVGLATVEDEAVLTAINERDQNLAARNKSVVDTPVS